MEEALGFFRSFEVWIYLVLGLAALIYIRKFFISWSEYRQATFGLERESAQGRLNQSALVLVLLLAMGMSEFILVSFFVPSVPGANPVPTSTLNLLATPTITLPVVSGEAGEAASTEIAVLSTNPGCVPGQVEIKSPLEGQELSGVVEISGTANIPDFGFYKLEIKRPDETIWLTLQAGNSIVQGGKLGDWDTRRLTPGDYQLGLVAVDNEAQPSPSCIIQTRVINVPEETPGP